MSGAFYFESTVSMRRLVIVMNVLRPDLPYLDVSSSPERLVEFLWIPITVPESILWSSMLL